MSFWLWTHYTFCLSDLFKDALAVYHLGRLIMEESLVDMCVLCVYMSVLEWWVMATERCGYVKGLCTDVRIYHRDVF